MAELVQRRWGCSDDKAVQRRAHSGGKKYGIEVCKILGQKDKVDKSHATHDLQVLSSWHYIEWYYFRLFGAQWLPIKDAKLAA